MQGRWRCRVPRVSRVQFLGDLSRILSQNALQRCGFQGFKVSRVLISHIYAGEVALPGGKAEEGDKDDADTATREAKEEIGLDPSLVTVVTVLEPFLSKVIF